MTFTKQTCSQQPVIYFPSHNSMITYLWLAEEQLKSDWPISANIGQDNSNWSPIHPYHDRSALDDCHQFWLDNGRPKLFLLHSSSTNWKCWIWLDNNASLWAKNFKAAADWIIMQIYMIMTQIVIGQNVMMTAEDHPFIHSTGRARFSCFEVSGKQSNGLPTKSRHLGETNPLLHIYVNISVSSCFLMPNRTRKQSSTLFMLTENTVNIK